MKTRKSAKALNSTKPLKLSAANGRKGAAKAVATNTEVAVLAAADRMEEGMEAVKASLNGVKEFGNEIIDVADNAGRTALGSVVAMNGSLVTYGRDAINDTLETSRKSFEVKSFKAAVDLQTEFTERRLKAMFHTVGALNSLAHTNTMAMWSPVADMLRSASDKGDDNIKANSSRFKSMI